MHFLFSKLLDEDNTKYITFEEFQKGLKNKDDASYVSILDKLKKDYQDFTSTFKDVNYPNFDDNFIEFIKQALDKINSNIKLFNAREGKIPPQNWKDAYARILIGGVGLERGYTIKGLTVTYLSRDKSRRMIPCYKEQDFWLP